MKRTRGGKFHSLGLWKKDGGEIGAPNNSGEKHGLGDGKYSSKQKKNLKNKRHSPPMFGGVKKDREKNAPGMKKKLRCVASLGGKEKGHDIYQEVDEC